MVDAAARIEALVAGGTETRQVEWHTDSALQTRYEFEGECCFSLGGSAPAFVIRCGDVWSQRCYGSDVDELLAALHAAFPFARMGSAEVLDVAMAAHGELEIEAALFLDRPSMST